MRPIILTPVHVAQGPEKGLTPPCPFERFLLAELAHILARSSQVNFPSQFKCVC